MQEHEYIYEHGLAQIQQHDSERIAEESDGPTGLEPALAARSGDKEVASESARRAEELEELRDHRATLRMGRGLTLALVLIFLVCLAAIWLSNTLISAPTQLLPVDFLQMLAANRVSVLCIPVVFLVICYFALRSLTREIMVGPESRLDERQKTLRNQAQRTAFKIVKFASVLVPVGFVLPHLPWFDAGAPIGSPLGSVVFHVADAYGGPIPADKIGFQGWPHVRGAMQGIIVWSSAFQPAALIQPASTLEIALAGGLLLVCLLVMFSALPMAVLAWRGKA